MLSHQNDFQPATLHYLWRSECSNKRFHTAVSLHSHTLHSRELFDFIPRTCARSVVLRGILARFEARHRERRGHSIDYARVWWTSPVCARQAFDIETAQIEQQLDLNPLISITDHDNMEAARLLSITSVAKACIWSVEWTVPYQGTFLHVGVHNVPPAEAESKLAMMNRFTSEPIERRLPELLDWLGSPPGSLVVLNHPLWDEKGIGPADHGKVVDSFLTHYRTFIHALELNGLRSWRENTKVLDLARRLCMSVVSGGDRHGTEPNATLNLTNARTFAEFAGGIRCGERSEILFMPQYRQSRTLRLLNNVFDIIGEHPAHSLGWTHICDRVFYLSGDGSHKRLTQVLSRPPHLVSALTTVARFARRQSVRFALRLALGEEVA